MPSGMSESVSPVIPLTVAFEIVMFERLSILLVRAMARKLEVLPFVELSATLAISAVSLLLSCWIFVSRSSFVIPEMIRSIVLSIVTFSIGLFIVMRCVGTADAIFLFVVFGFDVGSPLYGD